MKRFRFAAFCAALLAFTACDVVKQAEGLYNMTQCEYEYDSVTDLSLAGVNLSGELTPLQIARLLGVTKANVRYLRAAANGKKPKSTYRYREPCTVCPYSASCFTCPLPDCRMGGIAVNKLPDGFVYRLDH